VNTRILDKAVLKTRLDELNSQKISFLKFREWIFEVITSDDWLIEKTEYADLLKEIIFTFDDDSIDWTEALWREVIKMSIECINSKDPEKARTIFVKKVSDILKRK
jgi:hypothetical protein